MVEQSLNKQLTFEIILLLQVPSSICSNDAKSWYDRILHVIVSLDLQRPSLLIEPINNMLTAIQKMEYFIRTAYAVSKQSYGPLDDQPTS